MSHRYISDHCPSTRGTGAWTVLLATLLVVSAASPVLAQVHDNARIFSADAIKQAEDVMGQIKQRHRHELLVETYPAIPDDQQDDFKSKGKDKFYSDWAEARRSAEHISGVVVLIIMNPGHLQIDVGNETQKKVFTQKDREAMQPHLNEALKDKQYDDALKRTVNFVLKHMDANDPQNSGATGAAVAPDAPPPTTPPPFSSGQNSPNSTGSPAKAGFSFGLGAIICLLVGAFLVIFLLRSVLGGRRNGTGGGFAGGGGGYPPQGPGGFPQQGGGYPQGGYGQGPVQQGRGGGFGSGLLGGLLGGAVGGYAADRMMHHGDQNQGGGAAVPPSSYTPGADAGGGFVPDTSSSGGGSDFGSSDSSSGGGSDFGSSDSGGGGSDFGGGGDSGGSSSGSDF